MSEYVLNMANINNLPPVGAYRFRVTGMQEKVSAAGNPMIVWTVEIINGDFAGTEIDDYMVITQKALWRICAFVMACGFPNPEGQDNWKFVPTEYLNCEFEATLKHDTGTKGGTFPKIDTFIV